MAKETTAVKRQHPNHGQGRKIEGVENPKHRRDYSSSELSEAVRNEKRLAKERYTRGRAARLRLEELHRQHKPALINWKTAAIEGFSDILTEIILDATGKRIVVNEDGEEETIPVDSRLTNGARNMLLERVWPKESRILSDPVPIIVGDAHQLRASVARVIKKVGAQQISIEEGERMVGLIQRLIDIDAALNLEELREDMDKLKREMAGGSGRIIEGEVVPSWGRFRDQ